MEIDSIKSSLAPEFVFSKMQQLREWINYLLNYEPIILVGSTSIIVYTYLKYYEKIPLDGIYNGLRRSFFRTARKIPYVKRKVAEEIKKTKDAIDMDMNKLMRGDAENCSFVTTLPCAGLKPARILEIIKEYMKLGNYSWKNGSVSGTVYHGGEELTKLNAKVFEISAWTNPLHPDVFPGVCKMEAEIVRIVAELFHGGDGACGTVTSGGTESIILAVKAFRDYAIQENGIEKPEILVPVTAHAAFDKASQILGVGIKHVPIDLSTCKVDVYKMEKMITRRTCLLVGSAPGYPHGCIDDIKAISALGLKYNIPVHVDACLGGFLVAFMTDAGYPIEPFDFRLPGVKSISADTHKYGFAPKGSSVLIYRTIEFKHKQYFLQPNWPGGLYGSPTLAGSRPGAIIAGCWSSLMYFGLNGYIETTKKIIGTARYIESELKKIEGIEIMGKPEVSVVAFNSSKFNIYQLCDSLNKKGWNLNNLQFPPSIHICLTHCHTEPGVAERFIHDVDEAATEIKNSPNKLLSESVAVYGSAQKIPDRSLIEEITAIYLDSLYNTDCNIGRGSTQ